jgi:hypothetical protein
VETLDGIRTEDIEALSIHFPKFFLKSLLKPCARFVSITILSIATLIVMTLSITIVSMTTFGIMSVIITSLTNTQSGNAQHNIT